MNHRSFWGGGSAVLLAMIAICPAFAAQRTATSKGMVYFMMTAGGAGAPGALAPGALPLQTSVTATYTATYDPNTRTNRVTITKLDQSAMLTGVTAVIPCRLGTGVSTNVYANRTQFQQTLTAYSSGAYPGSYLISSTSRISGFIYPRTITLANPRLETIGVSAASNCMSWGRVVATLDLP